jgi:aryl-alcohol dehydrogenase-like predicted oxidoreductase
MNMNTRTLGKSGIQVKEIGLGLWPAGGDEWGPTDDRAILDVIDAALDEGINFYDTADVYGKGHSEELLGRAMKGRRDRFIVASKIGWLDYDAERGMTAYDTLDKFIAGVESNLRRLNTNHIDLLQSHINFRDPTMEIFLEGFHRLERDGKIRAYGCSSSNFDFIRAFNADGRCATLQIDYSILNRTPEEEIFPYCQANNIGVIVRGPLAMGILTGKMTEETRFPEGDFRRRWHEVPAENQIYLDDLAKVARLEPLAQDRTMAQLALRFTLEHPAVSVVIPGAKNLRQLRDNIGAAEPPLTHAEKAAIDLVVPPGTGRKIWPA